MDNPPSQLNYQYQNTTVNNEDFTMLVREKQTVDSSTWSPVYQNQNIQLYQTNDDVFTFKANMYFPSHIPEKLIYLLSCDLNIRRKWDDVYLIVRDIEELYCGVMQVDDHQEKVIVDIIYTCLKMPFGTTNRDSCLLRVRRFYKDEKTGFDRIMVMCKTTTHSKCEISEKYVRAIAPYHGYIVERDIDKNQCTLFVLSKHDIGGSIPKWIVSVLAKRKPREWYYQLRDVAEKTYKKIYEKEDKNTDLKKLENVLLQSKL